AATSCACGRWTPTAPPSPSRGPCRAPGATPSRSSSSSSCPEPLTGDDMHTITLLAALALASDPVNTTIYAIKKDDVGKLPGGWKADRTGEGKGSEWKVVADKTAPSKGGYVLAQTAKGPSRLFNLCVLEKSSFTDGEVSVRVKAVAGKID